MQGVADPSGNGNWILGDLRQGSLERLQPLVRAVKDAESFALRSDLGLLAEEYDTQGRRMLGDFPQALSRLALVNTARPLSMSEEKAKRATERGERPVAATEPT